MAFISAGSITPSLLMSKRLKAALASETLPKVIPTEQKDAEDTDDENEDEEVLVQENDEEEVCLNDDEVEEDMADEKEDEEVLVQENDEEEVCLNDDEDEEDMVVTENPAEGTITARNSSRSIAPSLSTSPNWKIASISVLESLTPPMLALAISSLEMAPSPSRSICLKAFTAPSLPL